MTAFNQAQRDYEATTWAEYQNEVDGKAEQDAAIERQSEEYYKDVENGDETIAESFVADRMTGEAAAALMVLLATNGGWEHDSAMETLLRWRLDNLGDWCEKAATEDLEAGKVSHGR